MDTLTYCLLLLAVVAIASAVAIVAMVFAQLRWMSMANDRSESAQKAAERAHEKMIGLYDVTIVERIKAAREERSSVEESVAFKTGLIRGQELQRARARTSATPIKRAETAQRESDVTLNGVPPWSEDHTDGLENLVQE